MAWRRPKFPPATLPDGPDEKTPAYPLRRCTACGGSGKKELEPIAPSVYRYVLCDVCEGDGILPPIASGTFTC